MGHAHRRSSGRPESSRIFQDHPQRASSLSENAPDLASKPQAGGRGVKSSILGRPNRVEGVPFAEFRGRSARPEQEPATCVARRPGAATHRSRSDGGAVKLLSGGELTASLATLATRRNSA